MPRGRGEVIWAFHLRNVAREWKRSTRPASWKVEDRELIVLGDSIGVRRTTWGRMRKLAENTTQGKPGKHPKGVRTEQSEEKRPMMDGNEDSFPMK
jgi:hypothetical protein